MLSFYADLLVRAIFAIPPALGGNMLGLVWPVIIVFCGEIIAWFVYGRRVVTAKWKKASLVGLAALVICYTLLFGWCALATNYQDHDALISRVRVLQIAYDTSAAREKYAVLEAQSKCAEMAGENKALVNQNRDQQKSINNCQNQAIKLLAPGESRVFPHDASDQIRAFQEEATKKGKKLGVVIVITNKSRSPVNGVFTCDRPITKPFAQLAGGYVTTTGGLSPRALHPTYQYGGYVGFLTPAWTPDVPLLIVFYYEGNDDIRCDYQEE